MIRRRLKNLLAAICPIWSARRMESHQRKAAAKSESNRTAAKMVVGRDSFDYWRPTYSDPAEY